MRDQRRLSEASKPWAFARLAVRILIRTAIFPSRPRREAGEEQDSFFFARGLPKPAETPYFGGFAKFPIPMTWVFARARSEAWSAALRPCEGAPLATQGLSSVRLPNPGSAEGGRRMTVRPRDPCARASSRDKNGAILHR